MKKYWQLIVIALVIVGALSTHYLQAAYASKKTNQFTFEKISGDEQYLNSLTIEADSQNNYDYSQLLITNKQTDLQQKSLFETSMPYLFQRLVDEHKSFMRGKLIDFTHFYEDEERLIYVREPDDIWALAPGDALPYTIEVLNKKDQTSHSFTVQSELVEEAEWITMQKIVLVGNELKFITNHMHGFEEDEWHLLTVDLKQQQLVSDQVIEKANTDTSLRSSIVLSNDYYHLGNEKYIVYSVNTYESKGEERVRISQHFKVLNLDTDEISDLELPKDVLVNDFKSDIVNQHHFIYLERTDDQVILHRYNIGQQQWLAPTLLPLPSDTLQDAYISLQAMQGKLYMTVELKEGRFIQILAIETGSVLYSGVIKFSENERGATLSIPGFYENNEMK